MREPFRLPLEALVRGPSASEVDLAFVLRPNPRRTIADLNT